MSGETNEKADRYDEDDLSDLDDEAYGGVASARARTSEDLRRHDRETLAAEEEAETLLGGGGAEKESRMGKLFHRRAERREARRQRRKERKKGKQGGKGELMYDMEQGERASSESSSELDMRRLGEAQAKQKVYTH